MRYFFTSLISLSVGAAVIAGISWIVGLIFPAAAFWVFVILFAWWAWIGWKHAVHMTEVQRVRRENDDFLNSN